jgi:catechol 2,3-dioxygenase-like lactoylglutathione lyase family enzyme
VADTGVQIDHIVIGVRDLDRAAAQFEDRCGLTTTEGGRHPGWGTANRLIPLGSAYLELVTVVDQAEASNSEFGRWISTMLEGNSRFGWAVRTDDVDRTALRLDLEVAQGSRRSQGGQMLHWRIAGVSKAARDSSLPFFIQWGPSTPLPGRATVEHRAGAVALGELTIEGDQRRLQEWLGTPSLPIRITPGTQGPASFTVRTSTNTIVVSPDDWQ